ncbi:uncharacterized protein LOC101860276 [Aplysia californica]|uniref:Uncharacterized protein LOC101860276 n=1 Tax=Aplysia californica TaxID=6500 RepID=A0ABM0K0L8_APLCA|nr:uncharacterized protein LOC101860276 [Aplysia californica]
MVFNPSCLCRSIGRSVQTTENMMRTKLLCSAARTKLTRTSNVRLIHLRYISATKRRQTRDWEECRLRVISGRETSNNDLDIVCQELRSARAILRDYGHKCVSKCFHNVTTKKHFIPSLDVLYAFWLLSEKGSQSLQGYNNNNNSTGFDLPLKRTQNVAHKKKIKVLQNKISIALTRYAYLINVAKYRKEGRPIVYIDEAWFSLSGPAARREKTGPFREDSHSRYGKSSRSQASYPKMLVMHAGGDMGFISATLSITKCQKSQTQSSEYTNSGLNSDVFFSWVNKHLLPNIPSSSIIVLDNASFHGLKSKVDMNESDVSCQEIVHEGTGNLSLHSKNVQFEALREKFGLPASVSAIFGDGHRFLRLPPYHSFLNPIELAWRDMRLSLLRDDFCCCFDNENNISEKMEKRLRESASGIDQGRWRAYIQHVMKAEDVLLRSEKFK